jgi:glycyl-tRNA synthetase beta chain
MPDLLLELLCEEIPARMQRRGADDLKRLISEALTERGLKFESIESFVTPRRLALHVIGLPAELRAPPDVRKGPRVGAPAAAVEGFLKSANLSRVEDAVIEDDPKKGRYYVAYIERPPRTTPEIIAEIVPTIIRAFPWPKSMRWGASSAMGNSLRWVRPLRGLLCTFGGTSGASVIPFEVDALATGRSTVGHRFMAPDRIEVAAFDDYARQLERAHVMLSAEARKETIRSAALDIAEAHNLQIVDDPALLDEVAGLVEWPIVLSGEFDASFLTLPAEVVRATIRANQKCFVMRSRDGALANRFILVANIAAQDGGAAIIEGNRRVVQARLSDALYFWRTDLADLPDFKNSGVKPLDQRLEKLRALKIVFHQKLGTQGERVDRIAALSRTLAVALGFDADESERAARLAKADLVTEMVGEFPELQGVMGRYYAIQQGEPLPIANAIGDHYRPQGPDDPAPSAPISIVVAMADKLDTLVGFWAVGEKPSGSKDPFALRRAALGVLRIVLENNLRLPLRDLLAPCMRTAIRAAQMREGRGSDPSAIDARGVAPESVSATLESLLSFFSERMKGYLRDRGARHDVIEAVFDLTGFDDLLAVSRRIDALTSFIASEEGATLLAGYRRAASILKAEERKDGAGAFSGDFDDKQFTEPAEMRLAAELRITMIDVAKSLVDQDVTAALSVLSRLRVPVDAFFEKVTVNADEPKLRSNRLRLLNALRRCFHSIADFSKVTP